MDIVQTKKARPPRMVLYGSGGTGKSSLAASFPKPLFMDIEGGLESIDTQSMPRPDNFTEVLAQLAWIYSEKHEFKTLIIDSLDHLENIINAHVCIKEDVSDLSDIGYGGGFSKAFGHFSTVMDAVSGIRDTRNMAIVLICHGHVVTYNNPSGPDYDRWALKLRAKSSDLFFEWATIVSFLHMNIVVKKETSGFTEKSKAIGGTSRILSCYPAAGWSAKNRYDISTDILIPSPEDGYNNLIKAITGDVK